MASIATTEGGGGTPLTFKNKTECGRDAFSWQIQYCWDILILLFSKMNLLGYRSSLPLRLSTAHLLYSDSLANSPSLQVLVKESSPVCILHIRAAPETEFYTFCNVVLAVLPWWSCIQELPNCMGEHMCSTGISPTSPVPRKHCSNNPTLLAQK